MSMAQLALELPTTRPRPASLRGLFWCVLPIGTDEKEAIEAATRKAIEAGHEEVREVRLREHVIDYYGGEAWVVLVATVVVE